MLCNVKIFISIFLITITFMSEKVRAGICCSKGYADEQEKRPLTTTQSAKQYETFINQGPIEEERDTLTPSQVQGSSDEQSTHTNDQTLTTTLKPHHEESASILEQGQSVIQLVQKSLPLTQIKQSEHQISLRAPIVFVKIIMDSQGLVEDSEAYELWGNEKSKIDFKKLKKNLPTTLRNDIHHLNPDQPDENLILNKLLVDILEICEKIDKSHTPDTRIARSSKTFLSKILFIPNQESPLGYILIKIDGKILASQE